jgi:hypothetical protein
MNDHKNDLFPKLHMYALMIIGGATALFFFFKILFG